MKNIKLMINALIVTAVSLVSCNVLCVQTGIMAYMRQNSVAVALCAAGLLCGTVLILGILENAYAKKRDMKNYQKTILPVINRMESAQNVEDFNVRAEKARRTIFKWSGANHGAVEDEARKTYTHVYRKTRQRLKSTS